MIILLYGSVDKQETVLGKQGTTFENNSLYHSKYPVNVLLLLKTVNTENKTVRTKPESMNGHVS